MTDKLLHIYGQEAWHDNVYIVGNREALQELKETIDEALTGVPHSMEAFISDGEGYQTRVILIEGDWDTPEWGRLAVPYSEDYAREQRDNALHPWRMKGGDT